MTNCITNCVAPNPFQESVLSMMNVIINSVKKTDDPLSFHHPDNLERYVFIEIASKLHVTFAAACFKEAFDEYIKVKPSLDGSCIPEKIWCYLVCKETDLKNSIDAMKKLLNKGFTYRFTYQLMSNYLTWAKNEECVVNDPENMTRYIETVY